MPTKTDTLSLRQFLMGLACAVSGMIIAVGGVCLVGYFCYWILRAIER